MPLEIARVLRRKELEIRDQEHFSQGPATLIERLRVTPLPQGPADALKRHQWMHGPPIPGGDFWPPYPLTVLVPCRMEEPGVPSEASGDQRCYVGKVLPKTLLDPPRRRDVEHERQSRRMKVLFIVTHESSNASSGDRRSFFARRARSLPSLTFIRITPF